jgi:hypothetical protein
MLSLFVFYVRYWDFSIMKYIKAVRGLFGGPAFFFSLRVSPNLNSFFISLGVSHFSLGGSGVYLIDEVLSEMLIIPSSGYWVLSSSKLKGEITSIW